MEGFFQAAAGVLLTVILTLTLSTQNKNMASILSMAVCAMVLLVGMSYLQPVMQLLERLESIGNLQDSMVRILLKVTGISVITEIAALACSDAGNGSLAQTLKMLGTAVILWLSIPIFNGMMDLVQKILEGL